MLSVNLSFKKDDTLVVKGIAIVWMLIHHLWGFPSRIAGGELKHIFTTFGQSTIGYLGAFGNICISFFFFLGGYGLYQAYCGKSFDLIGRIKKLYLNYWKVFLILIPLGFLLFGHQPDYCQDSGICHHFATFDLNEFLKNFFGISSSYNGEWWFFFSYLIALLSFPLVRHLFSKHHTATNFVLVAIGYVLIRNVFPAISGLAFLKDITGNFIYSNLFCQTVCVSSFWMGIACAQGDCLNRLACLLHKNHLLNPILDILVWIAAIYLRQSGLPSDYALDLVLVPVLCIVSIDLLKRVKFLYKGFYELGKNSMSMWLIHSFFCYYFYAIVKLVVGVKFAVISLVLLVLLSYVASILIDILWKWIKVLVGKIRTRLFYKEAGTGDT